MNQVTQYIQRTLWKITYKIEGWNDCPYCHGDGCEDDDWSCLGACPYCGGEGKVSIAKLWNWHWYESVQPAIHKVIARIAPKLWQAYQNKLDTEYKKVWEEELRKENNR